jgi:hypothetical protein
MLILGFAALVLAGLTAYVVLPLTQQQATVSVNMATVPGKAPDAWQNDITFYAPQFEIDPASCLVLNMEGVSAQKDGDICTVTITKGEYTSLVGMGGWCKALDTMTPAPDGAWVVKIANLHETVPEGSVQTFYFSLLRAAEAGTEPPMSDMEMTGILEDGTGELYFGSCLDQPASHI